MVSKKSVRRALSSEDIPFGPPPEEYSSLCSHCGYETLVNEAIIDFELCFAEFEGRKSEMPVLGCPNCNKRAMRYTKAH